MFGILYLLLIIWFFQVVGSTLMYFGGDLKIKSNDYVKLVMIPFYFVFIIQKDLKEKEEKQ